MGTDIILPPTGFLANSWKHNLFRLKTILPTLNDDSAAHWPAWNKKNKIKIKKKNRVGDLCWRSWSGPSLSAYARRHVFAWLGPNLILFHSSIFFFFFFFVHEANIIFVHERILSDRSVSIFRPCDPANRIQTRFHCWQYTRSHVGCVTKLPWSK